MFQRMLTIRHALLLSTAAVFAFAGTAAPGDVIVDDGPDGSPNPALTGDWNFRTEAQHPGTYNDTGLRFASGGDDTATYTGNIPTAGLWSVEIYMTDTLNQPNVPVEVGHAGGTRNLTINQNVDDATDGWMSLGVYNLNAGNNTYKITSDTGNTSTDAVRWAQAGVDSTTSFAVDSNAAGVKGFYSESGSWFNSSNRFNLYGNNDRLSDQVGDTATTSAPLEVAFYDIGLTWSPDDNRADNALVRITDAFGTVHDLRVDQTLAPAGDTEFDVDWQNLGNFAFDENSSVQLIVDQDAGGFVVSDGVRFNFTNVIPEPTSLALLGLGGLMIATRRRR